MQGLPGIPSSHIIIVCITLNTLLSRGVTWAQESIAIKYKHPLELKESLISHFCVTSPSLQVVKFDVIIISQMEYIFGAWNVRRTWPL